MVIIIIYIIVQYKNYVWYFYHEVSKSGHQSPSVCGRNPQWLGHVQLEMSSGWVVWSWLICPRRHLPPPPTEKIMIFYNIVLYWTIHKCGCDFCSEIYLVKIFWSPHSGKLRRVWIGNPNTLCWAPDLMRDWEWLLRMF